MYTFEFRVGNYFWDKQNRRLIKYGDVYSVDGQEGLHVAFPIPIDEGLLELIGFTNNNGEYIYKGQSEISIKIDGMNPYGVLTLFGKTIVFLNDIQNAFEDYNRPLNIDEKVLENMLTKSEFNSKCHK